MALWKSWCPFVVTAVSMPNAVLNLILRLRNMLRENRVSLGCADVKVVSARAN